MKETNIQVQLVDYTGFGHPDPLFAARKLVFTKSTRLQMTPDGFADIMAMTPEAIADELKYMVTTLPSSWEFVNATFVILDVSRACAQQITRTRWSPMESDIFGSYAMQAQRVVDVSDVACYIPPLDYIDDPDVIENYHKLMGLGMNAYQAMIAEGVKNEDARGLLPMHVASNLVVEFNLRALTELCRKRSSLRVQGEYNEVVRQMRELIISVWPWSEHFFDPKESIASKLLEETAQQVYDHLIALNQPLTARDIKMKLAKAADLIKVG